MLKLTQTAFIPVGPDECDQVKQMLTDHDKRLHYLAFDRQLYGFSSLGCFVTNDLVNRSDEIIGRLIETQEVCSLFPPLNLTLYPIVKNDSQGGYAIITENAEKNFADILHLNDEVYKTDIVYVDLGHGASNMDLDWLCAMLRKLKQESHRIKEIYIEETFVCNRCGRKLNFWDIQEDFSVKRFLGYGTKYDGDMLNIRLCCNCMEKLIDECVVSPITANE